MTLIKGMLFLGRCNRRAVAKLIRLSNANQPVPSLDKRGVMCHAIHTSKCLQAVNHVAKRVRIMSA